MTAVTEQPTRAELIEALGYLNADAKAMRRRGKVGTLGQRYEDQHGRIDALLTDLLKTE